MELTKRMQDTINEQINKEMWSANLYLSMSAHCAHVGLEGFAHWMMVQSKEEMGHAQDMMKFLLMRKGEVKILAVPEVETDFGTPSEIAEAFYKHECLVSELIQKVISVAREEKDMASEDFFWKYVGEQVEEEANASKMVDDFKLVGDSRGALMNLDRQLGQRAAAAE
ncbi:MAG: ferritin [Bacteroidetes bacterium]|nr:MAG: ferritin [Bacteroidota bacterium]